MGFGLSGVEDVSDWLIKLLQEVAGDFIHSFPSTGFPQPPDLPV